MKNLNVMAKLAVGFGLVMLLMIAMSVSNLMGLNDTSQRGENLSLIYQIEDNVVKLGKLSDSYLIRPDNKYLAETATTVAEIAKLSLEIQNRLDFSEGRARAGEIPDMAKAYSQTFTAFAAAHDRKVSSEEQAVENNAESDQLIADLNRQINGTPSNPVVHDSVPGAFASRLSAQLATARRTMSYQARGYLLTETDEAFQTLEESHQNLITIADQLQISPILRPAARNQLADAMDSTEQYMEVMREIPELVSMQRDAEIEMDKYYNVLYERAVELSALQNQLLAEQLQHSRMLAIGLSIAAIILAVLVAGYITRQIVQPLMAAVAIANELGERNMTGDGVENRRDEFGTLLRALDTTRSNLRHALGEVNGVTTQLAAAAEQLSVVTGQTSSGVHAQRVETEQVATAMNEMAATVHEVAQNSEEAAQAAQKADQQAQNGNQVLRTALDAITRLSGEVEQSAHAMHRLNENSTNISTVLTVINGIAEQTNLLALNAAIEAARAGEAGRGFAVVADEVRGLAQRTQESTAQIEDLIATLQAGAQDAVAMMDSSSALAGSTLELAQQAGGELEAITRTVSEIQAMNMQIATAAEEQSSVAEEINRSVINVNNIADQSAAAVEEMAASSADLARLGQSLQDLVSRFRV